MPWNEVKAIGEDALGEAPVYREPKQERGSVKFDQLLDATHQIVSERNVGKFSLSDVARRAEVATSSAYHFFPNVDAVLVALVGRYDKELTEIIRSCGGENEWRDVLKLQIELSRQYMNTNNSALKLLVSPDRPAVLRQTNAIGDSGLAQSIIETLQRKFKVPAYPPPAQLMHLAIAQINGIWELSVLLHGRITADYGQESARAVCAYLRQYWPEQLEPRQK